MSIENTSNNNSTNWQRIRRQIWGVSILLFGVLLPVITLSVELKWAMSAGVFFDPIPSWIHVVLIGIVPLSNLLSCLLRHTDSSRHLRIVLLLNSIAIGVSGIYTIMFLPITPIAILATISLIGLLPLTPLLSFIITIMCRFALIKLQDSDVPRHRFNLMTGIAIALICIIGAELPVTLTRVGMQMASSHDIEEQLRGIRLLRSIGDEDFMLRSCYLRPGRNMDMVSFLINWGGHPIQPGEARKVYYRITGQAFNATPPPDFHRKTAQGPFGIFGFDADQGGDSIGGQLKNVYLSGSTIDGSIDTDAALAYLEWTLELSNASTRLAEGRAQISLPPGAVVSRVTLWIDGEEREAAFAGRAQARQAYQQIVRRKRDPLLVTTAGTDTILLQLYPIPVNGTIKARIGITTPLLLQDKEYGVLRLPHFKERNFNINETLQHAVWLDAGNKIQTKQASLILEANNNVTTLRGGLSDPELNDNSSAIFISRDSHTTISYALDSKTKPTTIIRQNIVEQDASLDNVIMVIDTSRNMHDVMPQIAKTIQQLPENIQIAMILARDEIDEQLPLLQAGTRQVYRQLARQLQDSEFIGGVDNTLALQKAMSLAANAPLSAVLWIHGPQPVTLHSSGTLQQYWRRKTNGAFLYDFPTDNSVNRILEQLDGTARIQTVLRTGDIQTDLLRQFRLWSGGQKNIKLLRTMQPTRDKLPVGKKTSEHLIRLWAHDRILKLISENKNDATQRAMELAAHYQLVTPISGAVVLESSQQYKQAGLEPVASGSVPTIPEPQTWLLIICTLLILFRVIYQQQKKPLGARRFV